MKRNLFICSFIFFASLLNAQKIYFIYLQTEKGQPFFIRMNDKLYNSVSSGYLIIPRLIDSTYNFKLGFPGKDRDLNFTATINKKDHGYLIKDFGEKGWGIFDLQSLSVQMSSSNSKETAQFNNDSDLQINAFTDMLSKAADDASLKQNPVFVKEEEKKPKIIEAVVKEEKKPETGSITDNAESKSLQTKEMSNEEKALPEKKLLTQTEEVYKRSVVTKISGTTSNEGFESVFIDQLQNGKVDTVRILIPLDKIKSVVSVESKPEAKKEERKFLDFGPDTTKIVNNSQSEDQKKEFISKAPDKSESVSAEEKNNCNSIAVNDDFLKLRRKMTGKTDDEGMINEAKKYFKTKCFTTEQIKHLSSLFLSNAGKYNFFNASYNHISDMENFSSLQSELNDEFYINRFKKLLLR